MILERDIIKNALKLTGFSTIHEIKRLFPGIDEHLISSILTRWQLEGTCLTQEKICDVKKRKTIAYALAKEYVSPPVSPSLQENLINLLETMPDVVSRIKELETTNDVLTQQLNAFAGLTEKINGLCASIILLREEVPTLTKKIQELEDQVKKYKKKRKIITVEKTSRPSFASQRNNMEIEFFADSLLPQEGEIND